MSYFTQALSAFKNLDVDSFESAVSYLNKEQIQDLATKFNVTSAKVLMSGSWLEESLADLIDSSGNVVQKGVKYEQAFNGVIIQEYWHDSLALAAIFCLDPDIHYDFDEDSFEPGSMRICNEYPAALASYKADCTHEARSIRYEEIRQDGFDDDSCVLDYGKNDIKLSAADIIAKSIELELSSKDLITFPLRGSNYLLLWFLFSILFVSSGKSLEDLGDSISNIKDFLSENFDIAV